MLRSGLRQTESTVALSAWQSWLKMQVDWTIFIRKKCLIVYLPSMTCMIHTRSCEVPSVYGWTCWVHAEYGFECYCVWTKRSLCSFAGSLWSAKGSESGYDIAVQIATTGRYRIQNWFDRRMQADKTYVTEMLLDYDPIALDFDTPNPEGSQFEILGVAGDGYPDDSRFFIADLPTSFFPTGSFTREYEYAYLQILDYPADPTRVGFHRIEKLKPDSKIGYFSGAWTPAAGYTGDLGTWRLWGMNGEYITEIRVVDDGSVNRALLKYMIDVVRPERWACWPCISWLPRRVQR